MASSKHKDRRGGAKKKDSRGQGSKAIGGKKKCKTVGNGGLHTKNAIIKKGRKK